LTKETIVARDCRKAILWWDC